MRFLLSRRNQCLRLARSLRILALTLPFPLLILAGSPALFGGGFLLLFVEPDKQEAVRQALGDRIHVPFRFETAGSQIIFYEPARDYDEADRAGRSIAFKELSPQALAAEAS